MINWKYQNKTHKTEWYIHGALESCYLLIAPWMELEMYQIDEEVNVHLDKGQ